MAENKNETSEKKEFVSELALKKALLLSQIFSMIAIPVILALIGYWVQQSVQDQQIKRDYVSLAISLLVPKKDGEVKTSPELVNWAIKLLNNSAPIKLSESEVVSLKRNGIQPGDLIFFSESGREGSRVGIYLGDDKFIHRRNDGMKVDSLKQKKMEDGSSDVEQNSSQ